MNFNNNDYAALRGSVALLGITQDKDLRLDSAEEAISWFAGELDEVKAKTYDRQYPALNALRLFPTSSSINPGAETMTYHGYDHTGFADFIANYANDLPRADVFGIAKTANIRGIGDSYVYTIQDLRASRFSGKGLDARKAESARRNMETLVNRIAWCGDEKRGLQGVLTCPDIPIWTPSLNSAGTSTNFSDKTPDEIFSDFSNALQYILNSRKL